ncbi:WD40-repeat-containing domain protein [Chytriomyces sp. MP71]|nr:WD40-repeat-containing domain protein [Chytriomyces sp. MP71]
MSNIHHIASCSQCRSDGADTDTETVTKAVSTFCGSSVPTQGAIVSALLDRMHPSQLRCLAAKLALATRVDFIARLAPEIGLRILHFLDARSLCHAAQVAKHWRYLADDDLIWHRMCEQHIDKKCKTCGWGLPIIRTSARRMASNPSNQTATTPVLATADPTASGSSSSVTCSGPVNAMPLQVSETGAKRKRMSSNPPTSQSSSPTEVITPKKRSWKSIYAERLLVERNWRKPKYQSVALEGHNDGIMCIQYNDCAARFITGGHDNVIRVWDSDSNLCIKELTGHTQGVSGIQFDSHKIVSCSLDRTIRIWNMRDFDCIRILEGHRDGVVCLHYVDELLASGSADASIRVWNMSTGKFFTLRGHTDWVNKVHIYQKTLLFSCSDDRSVRLWNLETRQVLRQFQGHNDQVQSLSISLPHLRAARASVESKGGTPKLVTASADKTVKIWDIDTGICLKTLFGHESAVMCVASDTLRIVTGTTDNRIIVFDLESGKQMHSMGVDHMLGMGAINCCALSDTKIITGGEDGFVRIYNFYPDGMIF